MKKLICLVAIIFVFPAMSSTFRGESFQVQLLTKDGAPVENAKFSYSLNYQKKVYRFFGGGGLFTSPGFYLESVTHFRKNLSSDINGVVELPEIYEELPASAKNANIYFSYHVIKGSCPQYPVLALTSFVGRTTQCNLQYTSDSDVADAVCTLELTHQELQAKLAQRAKLCN